jgi:hypothetical protein
MMTVVALLSIGLVGTVALANTSVLDRTPAEDVDPDNPPPRPEWVNADGTINHEKAPECIEAVGPDGLTITKSNGEPLCIPFDELHGPPSEPPPVDVDKANGNVSEIQGPDGEMIMIVPEERPSILDE